MEFWETISAYASFWGLFAIIGAPIVIFSATPRMSFWYKAGRIIFLWLCAIVISGSGLYETLSDPEEIERWWVTKDAYEHHILLSIWFIFLMNVYIGWFEFLWRCIYKQWAWPPLRNLQYGFISNVCILGSASFTIPLALLLIVVSIFKFFY